MTRKRGVVSALCGFCLIVTQVCVSIIFRKPYVHARTDSADSLGGCHHQWLRFLSLVWAPCHHPLLLQYLHFHFARYSYRLQSCQSLPHTTPFFGISLLLLFPSASQFINELDNFAELFVVVLLFNDM